METSDKNRTNATQHMISTEPSPLLEIHRDFDVSVNRIFASFKSPEVLKAWWWPKGLFADRIEMDFREGGRYFISMKGYERGGGGMTGEFEEIIENRRIVMSDQFADEQGRPISAAEAQMPGIWPKTVYITLEFEALTDSSSQLHLFQEGIPVELHEECIKGWSESFDKLDEHLRTVS